MKNIRFLTFVLIIGSLLLSACGAATPTPAMGGGRAEAMPIAFLGTVESITGNQWVISGTTVTVDSSVVRDGPFKVGDHVKVEGVINPDGSFIISRVEIPTPQDVSSLSQFGDDNSNNANVNDDNSNINDDHGNDANINDDRGNDTNINDVNINDDHGNDTNVNDDHGNDVNANDANVNDDHGGVGGSTNTNTNTNDDHGGTSGSGGDGGNDNGGKGTGG